MAKPFEGLRVYYSGSVKGSPEPDPELPWKLIRYIANNGAELLCEHVSTRSPAEMDEIGVRRIGRIMQQLRQEPNPSVGVRRQCLQWVDDADCIIALVNGSSHGVGMEIQHAVEKPKFGLNQTPILFLVRSDVLPRLSPMVLGITPEENPGSELKEYSTGEDAQQHIFHFLSRRKSEKETGQPRNERDLSSRILFIDKPEDMQFIIKAAAEYRLSVSVFARPGETYPCAHGVLGTVKEGDVCFEISGITRGQDLRNFWLKVGSLKKTARSTSLSR
jgi:hypothetical protein